jgi:hypothetical protein
VEDIAISTGLPPMSIELGQPFRVERRHAASRGVSGGAEV